MDNKLFLIIISISLHSCELETTDKGKYYEGKNVDELYIIIQPDTANLVIEQHRKLPIQKNNFTFSFKDKNDNSDLIILRLFSSFGSYSQKPQINIMANYVKDTVFIWYDSINWDFDNVVFDNSFNRNNSNNLLTEANPAPKLEFIIIDSIWVFKSKNKVISLKAGYKFKN